MERKNIPFQYGIHRTPSMANDGELSECINIEAHNGELTPSVMPEIAFSLQEGDKLLYVHTSGNYKNYIIQRGEKLCWFSDEEKDKVDEIGDFKPTSIHSVGNTLVVLSETQMEYILYKSGEYKPIGSRPPFCSISFGLRPKDNRYIRQYAELSREELNELYPSLVLKLDEYISEKGEFTFDLESIYKDVDSTGSEDRLDEVNLVNKMTELYHSVINKAIESGSKYGCFSDSFFIRYAYRMYDGSHYMQSAPCFIPICTDGYLSEAFIQSTLERGNPDFGKLGIGGEILRLMIDYQIVGFYNGDLKTGTNNITDWEDIIKGIDIFVTKGIRRINSDSKVYGFSTTNFTPSGILYYGIPRPNRGEEQSNNYINNTYNKGNKIFLNVEKESKEDYDESIKSSSLFYKIASIKGVDGIYNEYGKSRRPLSIKENTLTNLEQQEVLDDDYDSHNDIIPSFAHVYNGRLNISGIITKLFSGFPMESMVPYTYNEDGKNHTWTVKTSMEIEGKDIEVVSKSNIKLYEKPPFVYYPSTKVKKFKLYMYDEDNIDGTIVRSSFSSEYNSEVHKLLNGSFYLSPTFGVEDVYQMDVTAGNPLPSGDPYISYPNKIYTSEINNPFFFPLSGRNSIGTGDIIAISSNTKAISPGQFGQYPMIVFSTDGVWAMQVAGDGLYESIHPISKDICVNPNVLQTNGPILFATDNGLYSVISESVEHISQIMKGAPDIMDIPEVDSTYGFLLSSAKSSESFNSFLKDAIFAHDYINNRVVIYNPEKEYSYIYCMDCGMFAKMVIQKEGVPTRIQSVVKAYPEVYMQSGTDIYTFVHDKDILESIPTKGIAITRPISFSDPLAMKVINDVRLIYRKRNNGTRCKYAMFVSNDGNSWSLRTSLRGRSFKYFRFAVYTELADTDALVAMSVMFDYRRTNKLR